jgi:HPt (histidine-containing phosphotransfer) domain-containing protein
MQSAEIFMTATETSAGATPTMEPSEESAAWTVEALRSVWERQQDRVGERIGVIERAVAALADDRLDTDLRREAERATHMLAGSVGMFGFIDASDAARELESKLADPTSDQAPELSMLLLRLRGGVRGPVGLCTESVADQWAHRDS